MDSAPDALRTQAREWGRTVLLHAPWEPLTERLSLILVAPPKGTAVEFTPPHATLWMLIDRASTASLPESSRQLLVAGGAAIEYHARTASSPPIELIVRTSETIENISEGTTRRSMELRWALQHSEAISDRLRRLEPLAAQARMLPPTGLERAVRSLWLDAYTANRALWPLRTAPEQAMIAVGELVGSILRLAGLMDEGAYPPTEFLRLEMINTRIGQRIAPWLSDLEIGVAGDEAGAQRAINAAEQVLDEVRTILRERYADRDWLRTPAESAFGRRR